MSPAVARPLLHAVHLLTFIVLLGTGLLLFVPGLRAAVTGGYSLLIRDAHRWGGVAFVVLPALVISSGGARRIFAPPSQPTARARWQGLHVMLTIVISVVFTLTGFVLWGKRLVPEAIFDSAMSVHDWLTYAAGVLVTIHLFDAGLAALLARVQEAAAVGEHPET